MKKQVYYPNCEKCKYKEHCCIQGVCKVARNHFKNEQNKGQKEMTNKEWLATLPKETWWDVVHERTREGLIR